MALNLGRVREQGIGMQEKVPRVKYDDEIVPPHSFQSRCYSFSPHVVVALCRVSLG
jgi:hypothetical protein